MSFSFFKSESQSGSCKHEKWYYECGTLAIFLNYKVLLKRQKTLLPLLYKYINVDN